jgi:DNA-binding transcriptional LysR family regulator
MSAAPKKPTIDSRQVLAFVELARCGSFTAAAKQLFLTQSAVSYAIKALEDDLGFRLVDRSSRRVSFTPAGQQFLRHAEKILREMELARAHLVALAKAEPLRAQPGALAKAPPPQSIRAVS